jgi:hypothetical protein
MEQRIKDAQQKYVTSLIGDGVNPILRDVLVEELSPLLGDVDTDGAFALNRLSPGGVSYFFDKTQSPSMLHALQSASKGTELKISTMISDQSDASYNAYSDTILIKTHPPLPSRSDSQVKYWLSTAHELFHAVQWQNRLRDATTPSERYWAYIKHILEWSRKRYTIISEMDELNAEQFAWKCLREIDAQGSSMNRSRIDADADDRAGQFFKAHQDDYERSYEDNWDLVDKSHHIVKKGESLTSIARDLWGDSDYVGILYELNKTIIGGDITYVQAGQILFLVDPKKVHGFVWEGPPSHSHKKHKAHKH